MCSQARSHFALYNPKMHLGDKMGDHEQDNGLLPVMEK